MKQKLKLWGIDSIQGCEPNMNIVAPKVIDAITYLECDKNDGTLWFELTVPCDDVKGYYGHNGIAYISLGSNDTLKKSTDIALEIMHRINLSFETAKVCFAYMEYTEDTSIQEVCDIINFLTDEFDDNRCNIEIVPILQIKKASLYKTSVALILLH